MTSKWDTFKRNLRPNLFSPIDDDKVVRYNSRTLLIVEKDGSVRERVSLQVSSKSHREHLISTHYLRMITRNFLGKDIGIYQHSRDSPWDFDLELSTGTRFFVEITSIADNRYQFERDQRERLLRNATNIPTIRMRDLRKLARMFPEPRIEKFVDEHAKTPADLVVENPLFKEHDILITGNIVPPINSLSQKIIDSINTKVAKRHDGKDNTVLILDFQGNFIDRPTFEVACDETAPYFETCPFAEVWFYVGYFSDDDGNNAEFSFTPLKLGQERIDQLRTLARQHGVDELGRLVF